MYCLGFVLEFGRGVKRDQKEAAAWYERAAARGLAEVRWTQLSQLGPGAGRERKRVSWSLGLD